MSSVTPGAWEEERKRVRVRTTAQASGQPAGGSVLPCPMASAAGCRGLAWFGGSVRGVRRAQRYAYAVEHSAAR